MDAWLIATLVVVELNERKLIYSFIVLIPFNHSTMHSFLYRNL